MFESFKKGSDFVNQKAATEKKQKTKILSHKIQSPTSKSRKNLKLMNSQKYNQKTTIQN